MEFEYTTNDTCHSASGLVVVIDVLRAFSNAAYAFSVGAESDQFPNIASDLDYCIRLDIFSFSMPITCEHGRPVMRAVVPASRISTLS